MASQACERWCQIRLDFQLNVFSHIGHWNGLSPECRRRCRDRLLESANLQGTTTSTPTLTRIDTSITLSCRGHTPTVSLPCGYGSAGTGQSVVQTPCHIAHRRTAFRQLFRVTSELDDVSAASTQTHCVCAYAPAGCSAWRRPWSIRRRRRSSYSSRSSRRPSAAGSTC